MTMYEFEKNKRCLINFNATWEFRELAHKQAKRRNMTLTEYLKWLVNNDVEIGEL